MGGTPPARTILGTYLLKPTERNTDLFLGVLGRAQESLGFEIYAYACLSNHYSMLIGVQSAEHISEIMCFVHGNVAKELGHASCSNWPGRFWGRRGRAILCLDDANLADRLEYILSQGVKENLVCRAERWPGAHCAKAFVSGKAESGHWIDRTRLRALEKKARKRLPEAVARTEYKVNLSKLPCWQSMSREAYVRKARDMLAAIAKTAEGKRAITGKRVLGVKAILKTDPHHRPGGMDTSPAPAVHCVDPNARRAFMKGYREFIGDFWEAQARLFDGVDEASFPDAGIRPGQRWRHAPG